MPPLLIDLWIDDEAWNTEAFLRWIEYLKGENLC